MENYSQYNENSLEDLEDSQGEDIFDPDEELAKLQDSIDETKEESVNNKKYIEQVPEYTKDNVLDYDTERMMLFSYIKQASISIMEMRNMESGCAEAE